MHSQISNEHSLDTFEGSTIIKGDKRVKQFDFFFLRTCFRTMNEFYKTEYQTYFSKLNYCSKVSLSKISGSQMQGVVKGFIDQIFGPRFLEQFEEPLKMRLVKSMMAFVYAHRHNKEDLFLKESHLDFTILRDCMYHYSKKA